jgi:hypothetical protein
MVDREDVIFKIAIDVGSKYMQSRWAHVNNIIRSELPNATINEGMSTQFNCAIQDMARVIVALQEYAIDHNMECITVEEYLGVLVESLRINITNINEDKRQTMN